MKKNTILKTAFDEYTIVEQIGEGGNGTVYKVSDSANLPVAIKVVPKNISREKLKRFKNEIYFCLKNPNDYIIKVLDNGVYSDEKQEYIFYVMPLYAKSLRQLMKEGIFPDQSMKAFADICKGLAFAHSKGCIHRDLKPENILFDGKSHYIIADFGIAHFQDSDKFTTVETRESSRLANFSYHAPEQIENSGSITAATDIFALGLILNEMFTGKIPSGDNYKKISEVNADFAFLDKVVQKMLSQNPNGRYQSIDELNIDFEARKKAFENNKKIAVLSQPLVEGEARDFLTDNPIKILDCFINNGQLIAKLSNTPNDWWEKCYDSALSYYTSSPFCYKNFVFMGNEARYDLEGYLQYGNSKQLVESLIKDFKQAVENANRIYAEIAESSYQERRRQEIARRQAEIQRLESENEFNDFLKGLL